MGAIRTTKIDGQEFVTLTDYLRLKEEKQELERELNMVKIRYNKACEEINYRTEVEAKLYKDMDKLYTELAKYEDID